MLGLLLDTVLLWFLLNIFSDENWDDQKLKVFGIAIAIALLGGIAAFGSAIYVGVYLAIVAYCAIGIVCLWGLASLPIHKAAAAMGIFLVIKMAIVLGFSLMFATR